MSEFEKAIASGVEKAAASNYADFASVFHALDESLSVYTEGQLSLFATRSHSVSPIAIGEAFPLNGRMLAPALRLWVGRHSVKDLRRQESLRELYSNSFGFYLDGPPSRHLFEVRYCGDGPLVTLVRADGTEVECQNIESLERSIERIMSSRFVGEAIMALLPKE